MIPPPSWTRSGPKNKLEADLGWKLQEGWTFLGEAAYLYSQNQIQYWEQNPIPEILKALPPMFFGVVESASDSESDRLPIGPYLRETDLWIEIDQIAKSLNFVSALIVPIFPNISCKVWHEFYERS